MRGDERRKEERRKEERKEERREEVERGKVEERNGREEGTVHFTASFEESNSSARMQCLTSLLSIIFISTERLPFSLFSDLHS